ncbi:MAG TPA: CHAT domain-containing protein [Thermoanaerobaculia bacterium]|nr:CHAT domain-containing protein [Thermoanaerobaculia bacterium]
MLASLWRVEDEATAELMHRFYHHLRVGKAKDEALRAAQLDLIRSPLRVPDGRGGWTERNAAARTSGPPCSSSATGNSFFLAHSLILSTRERRYQRQVAMKR